MFTIHNVHNALPYYTMLQHVLWRGSARNIKDAAPARLVLRTSGTAATWIYMYCVQQGRNDPGNVTGWIVK